MAPITLWNTTATQGKNHEVAASTAGLGGRAAHSAAPPRLDGRPAAQGGAWNGKRGGEACVYGGAGGVAFYDDELDGDLDGMMRDHPDFRELCEDMGIDPNTHPGLLRGRGDRSRFDR